MEYVYKLNLPMLPEILLEGVADKIFNGDYHSFKRIYDPRQIIKPEWLNWNGFQFNQVDFFYKNNFIGIAHVDAPRAWGINWIHQGFGEIHYWLPENITKVGGEFDELGSPRYRYTVTNPPDKTYITLPGAYLVNAGIPHLVSGFDGRYAFSLRELSRKKHPLEWKDVVDKFKHLIIKD